METRTQWAVVSTYGSRIRLAGEMLEFCEAPLDDFASELDEVEHSAKKIREQIAFIRGMRLEESRRLNREMLRDAFRRSSTLEEMEKEIFG